MDFASLMLRTISIAPLAPLAPLPLALRAQQMDIARCDVGLLGGLSGLNGVGSLAITLN